LRQISADFEAKLPDSISKPNGSSLSWLYTDLRFKRTGTGLFWSWKDMAKEAKKEVLKSIDTITNNSNYTAGYLRSISAVDFQYILNETQKRAIAHSEQIKKANKK